MSSQPRTRQAIATIKRAFGKNELLGMVADGHSLRHIAKICSERTGVSLSHYFIHACMKTFGEEYQAAKRAKAQLLVDKAGELADRVTEGQVDPTSARTAAGIFQWTASRLDPAQWGDKLQADIQVTDFSRLHLAAVKARMVKFHEAGVVNALPSPARDDDRASDDSETQ